MSDLFDPLRDLDDLSSPPLPASEVRRRGDRMRRRRHALQALGGAAAVVLVAAGVAVTTGLPDRPTDDPTPVATPSPEGGWLSEIPTHYPLDRGYPMAEPPETTQLGPSQKFSPLTDQPLAPCGATAYPSEHPVDSVGTVFTVLDDVYARELTLYADSTQADAVVSHLVDAWEACPTEELPDPPFELTTSVNRDTVGDDSWTVVRGASQFPGVQTYHVVRVGNAVLVNTASTEATLENVATLLDEQSAQVGPLVADMCIFALAPCGQVDRPDVEPTIPALPDDVLLNTETLEATTTLRGMTGWEELGAREDPTLDCQPVWLRNLGADKGAFGEWNADGSEAATAVMEFRGPARAAEAFTTVRGWLETCDARMQGTRALSPVADLRDLQVREVAPTITRQFFAPTTGGAQRLDQQGAALLGNRIVFLAVSPSPATGVEEELLDDVWTDVMGAAVDFAVPIVEPGGVDIPDDFPLLDGWPSDELAESEEDGRFGPSRLIEPFSITRCGMAFDAPEHVDELRATWTNPEDYRSRSLTTYATADEAVAAMNALRDFWTGCTSEPVDDHTTQHYVVRPTSVGGQSFGLVTYWSYDGAPAIGLSTHHAVRVGRAVLIDSTSNEGMGDPDDWARVDGYLEGQADDASAVIARMCLFTEAGC